MPINFYR